LKYGKGARAASSGKRLPREQKILPNYFNIYFCRHARKTG
jgi:hypothetical protein